MSYSVTKTASAAVPVLRNIAPVATAQRPRSTSSPEMIVVGTETSSEAYATAGSAGQKEMDATLNKMRTFEKAMASYSYGFSTIYYGLILPLKDRVLGGLDLEQARDLDFYRKHTALSSGIKKVQKAFKAYTAAQEAVDKAPINPETAREGARRQAIAAGTALVTKYEDLIELAIDQAEEIKAGQAVYLKDLHGELDKDGKGLILNTVNTIRPNIAIEPEVLNEKDSPEAELKKRYQEFVTDFVSKVQEAHRQAGDSLTLSAVTEAFIQGLAAIPELGELGDGLVLIELYDELSQKQTDVAGAQALAIQKFKAEIEALMNTDQPITAEELQNIQYNGISLQSVKSIDVKELNKLKALRRDLKEAQEGIQVAQAEIKKNQAIIEKEEPYSFDDVKAFITDVGVGFDALVKACQEDGALGRLAKFYTGTSTTHDRFTREKGEIQARKAAATEARTQGIKDNQAAVDGAKTAIVCLDKEIADVTRDLAAAVKKLAEFEKASKTLAGGSLSADAKDAYKIGYDIKKKTLEAEINRLKGSLEVSAEELENKQDALERFNSDLKNLHEKYNLSNTKDDLSLSAVEEFLSLTNRQTIVLSGKDVKVITEKLGGTFSKDIKIFEKLNQVYAAEARVLELTSEEPELKEIADEITKTLSDRSRLLTLNDKQTFVLDAAFFDLLEKAKITQQLESNLVIAKKVTLEVAQVVVTQDNAVIQQAIEASKGDYKLNRALTDSVSKLGVELVACKKAESNEDSLDQLIKERVKNLSPVVRKKAVKAGQPLSAPAAQPKEAGASVSSLLHREEDYDTAMLSVATDETDFVRINSTSTSAGAPVQIVLSEEDEASLGDSEEDEASLGDNDVIELSDDEILI